MTERQKQLAIVASVVIVGLLLLLRGKPAANTVINQAAPFSLGDVTLPGFDMPPRAIYDIPAINIGAADGLVASAACCASCDSSGSSYYIPVPALPPSAAPAVVAKLPVPVTGPRTSVSFSASNTGNSGGIPWWDMVGVTGK